MVERMLCCRLTKWFSIFQNKWILTPKVSDSGIFDGENTFLGWYNGLACIIDSEKEIGKMVNFNLGKTGFMIKGDANGNVHNYTST